VSFGLLESVTVNASGAALTATVGVPEIVSVDVFPVVDAFAESPAGSCGFGIGVQV
jgi:hypothetical protein